MTEVRAATRACAKLRFGLVLLALALPALYGLATRHGPALADEFIYLAGARHFAATGTLHARFYDAHAILQKGYPHQDNHSPGFVLILGALTKLVPGGYWTSVTLNLVAFFASLGLIQALARELGRTHREALVAAALLLLLPAFLPYAFWVMAEVVLVAWFLTTLLAASRLGHTVPGALLTGALFGVTFLVRESALFGLPAVLALLRSRRAVALCLAAAVAFGLLVYAPLSANRSPGASNFWTPTYGTALGYQIVQAALRGDIATTARLALERASMNLAEVFSETTWTEGGILAGLVSLPLWALARWHGRSGREKRFLFALVLGWAALVAVMSFVYVLARWAGFRYLLFLAPPFLPFVVRPPSGAAPRFRPAAAFALFSIVVNLGVFKTLTDFKTSRQKRQEGITAYVERYVDTRQLTRVALPSGWLFGLKHYPVEVISSLPEEGGPLRLLEQKIAFDYLVLPGQSPLREEWDGRLRYRRLNLDDPEPPLLVYKRLK